MAVGTVGGALVTASVERPQFELFMIGAIVFGVGFILEAVAPS